MLVPGLLSGLDSSVSVALMAAAELSVSALLYLL